MVGWDQMHSALTTKESNQLRNEFIFCIFSAIIFSFAKRKGKWHPVVIEGKRNKRFFLLDCLFVLFVVYN